MVHSAWVLYFLEVTVMNGFRLVLCLGIELIGCGGSCMYVVNLTLVVCRRNYVQ